MGVLPATKSDREDFYPPQMAFRGVVNMGQKVVIAASVTDEDGSEFASITLTYNAVPREGVLLMEEQLIAMQSNLLGVAKAIQAAKAA